MKHLLLVGFEIVNISVLNHHNSVGPCGRKMNKSFWVSFVEFVQFVILSKQITNFQIYCIARQPVNFFPILWTQNRSHIRLVSEKLAIHGSVNLFRPLKLAQDFYTFSCRGFAKVSQFLWMCNKI